jgi:Flp pilus assembly protein TadD
MSLLMDALKRAEQAKQDAQERDTAAAPATSADKLELKPLPPSPATGETLDQPSGSPRSLDFRLDSASMTALRGTTAPAPNPAPKSSPPARGSAPPPAPAEDTTQGDRLGREMRALRKASERRSAENLWAAKHGDESLINPFFLTVAALLLVGVGIGLYFWWQLRPPPSAVVVTTSPVANKPIAAPAEDVIAANAPAVPTTGNLPLPAGALQPSAIPAGTNPLPATGADTPAPGTLPLPAAPNMPAVAPPTPAAIPPSVAAPALPLPAPTIITPAAKAVAVPAAGTPPPTPSVTSAPAAMPSPGPAPPPTAAVALPAPPPAAPVAPADSKPAARVESAPIKLTRSSPSAQIDPNLETAYSAFRSGDWKAAQDAYAKVLATNAQNRDALLGLGAIELRNGRPDLAEAYYSRVLEANPRDPEAQAGLLTLRGGRDPVKAESRIKSLITERPEAGLLHFALGNSYASQNRWREAQQAYFRAFSADSENADFAFNLAVSLDQLRQTKPALDYYQKALKLSAGRGAGFDRKEVEARIAGLSR